jgi:hypothetical protein
MTAIFVHQYIPSIASKLNEHRYRNKELLKNKLIFFAIQILLAFPLKTI